MNGLTMLANAGDSPILPIVIGVVAVALVIFLIALVIMIRRRK